MYGHRHASSSSCVSQLLSLPCCKETFPVMKARPATDRPASMLLLSETHDGVLQRCMAAPVRARPRAGTFTQKLTGTTPPRWRTRRATGSARRVVGKWHMVLCALQTWGRLCQRSTQAAAACSAWLACHLQSDPARCGCCGRAWLCPLPAWAGPARRCLALQARCAQRQQCRQPRMCPLSWHCLGLLNKAHLSCSPAFDDFPVGSPQLTDDS